MTIPITKAQADHLSRRQLALNSAKREAEYAAALYAAEHRAMNDALMTIALDGGAPPDAEFEGARTELRPDGQYVLILADKIKPASE